MQSLQQIRRTITTAQLLVIVVAAAFLVPSGGNDIKDLAARISGRQVAQCATWSLVRPPCRR
jgi:hypothetical protein